MVRVIAAEQTPGRRRRSEQKRAVILDAAEALFLSDGYGATTVDAVAARAEVSKRTVYDHFGDKASVFVEALERRNESLVTVIRRAIDEELGADRELRDALIGFGERIATQTFASSEYVAYRRLLAAAPTSLAPAPAVRDRPDRLLEERFAALAQEGRMTVSDPRVAARHFTALTVRLALEAVVEDAGADEDVVRSIIADGVDVFLRAYR